MKRGVRIVLWLMALLIACGISFVTYMVAGFGRPVASDYANRLPFDSAEWKLPKKDSDPLWPTRLRMVDHLLAKHSLTGMQRSEVVQLLGPPDDTPYFRAPNNMVYYLGPERGMFRIDSEWLVIEVSAQTVLSAEIRTD